MSDHSSFTYNRPKWKSPKHPLKNEWISKLHSYNGIIFSMRKNRLLVHVAIGMNLNNKTALYTIGQEWRSPKHPLKSEEINKL